MEFSFSWKYGGAHKFSSSYLVEDTIGKVTLIIQSMKLSVFDLDTRFFDSGSRIENALLFSV
jgi:hypothetical protein